MLKKSEVKKYYDNFGEKQDWQGFYENKAIETLIKQSNFQNAQNILEFGCGTGKFAKDILENHTTPNSKYIGIDISETMCRLASKRLKTFQDQAEIKLTNGSTKLDFLDNTFDRFVSNYALDILNEKDIDQLFTEVNRILKKEGLLSITSLSCGESFVTKKISDIWQRVYNFKPTLVGGCRPLSLLKFVDKSVWQIKYHSKISSFGITSEVLIIEK